MTKVDLSEYKSELSRKNQIARLMWAVTWTVLARPLPRSVGSGWKRFLLRLYGAKLHPTATVYSSVKVHMPWNLIMHEHTCLGPQVDCYNVATVTIEAHATVSQKTYLCTASHDVEKSNYPLITSPIVIREQAWIGANAYINLGVIIGKGAVVGATASVYKNVEPWTIVGGNPAKFIKERKLNG